MKTIEHVLTDVDGTLTYAAQQQVSERVHEAVLAVQKQDIILTPVTGRPFEMASELLRLLGFKGYGVFDGGASVRSTVSGELIWSKWLEPDTLAELAEIIVPHCEIIDFYPGLKEVTRTEALEDMKHITEPAPYLFALMDEGAIQEIIAAVNGVPDVTMHVGPGRPSVFPGCVDVQITHRYADKFHGVKALREIEHSSIENTLAIGDASNDLPLFLNAGVKVAMGNATDTLKAMADHVVAPVEQDGFAEAMERFVLQ